MVWPRCLPAYVGDIDFNTAVGCQAFDQFSAVLLIAVHHRVPGADTTGSDLVRINAAAGYDLVTNRVGATLGQRHIGFVAAYAIGMPDNIQPNFATRRQ